MPITKDASTPAAVDNQASAATTAVTASFSPPAGCLIAVAVNIVQTSSTAAPTVTVADSLSNTFTAGPTSGWAFSSQGAFFFQRYYATAPGSITVTATRSNTTTCLFEVNTWVLTGAAADQTAAAAPAGTNGNTTAETSSVTTTQLGSWALCAIACSNVAPTPSGLTEDQHHQDGTDGAMGAAGHAVTAVPGPATIGWTSVISFWAWAAWEILPAAAGTSPAVIMPPRGFAPMSRQFGPVPAFRVPYHTGDVTPVQLVQVARFTGSNSATLPAATTAGNTLVVAYAGSAGAGSTGTCSTSGITLGGTAMTKLAEVDAPSSASAGCAAFYMLAALAGGQTAIVVSGTSLVAADAYLVAWEVSGLGTTPALDVSSTREDHSGTQAWSSDAGTAPVTTSPNEFWAGLHAAGPNSGQPDTFTVTDVSWANQPQFNWGSPGGASVAAHKVVTGNLGPLRYAGNAADFDFCVTAAVAIVPGTTAGPSPGVAALAMDTQVATAVTLAAPATLAVALAVTAPAVEIPATAPLAVATAVTAPASIQQAPATLAVAAAVTAPVSTVQAPATLAAALTVTALATELAPATLALATAVTAPAVLRAPASLAVALAVTSPAVIQLAPASLAAATVLTAPLSTVQAPASLAIATTVTAPVVQGAIAALAAALAVGPVPAVQGAGASLVIGGVITATAGSGATLAAALAVTASAVQGSGASLAAGFAVTAPAVQGSGASLVAAVVITAPAVTLRAPATLTAAFTVTAASAGAASGAAVLAAVLAVTATGTVTGPGPAFTVGVLTASVVAAATQAPTDKATSAQTASTAPQSTITAADKRTGGPGG